MALTVAQRAAAADFVQCRSPVANDKRAAERRGVGHLGLCQPDTECRVPTQEMANARGISAGRAHVCVCACVHAREQSVSKCVCA
jgi:hypothetical protein